VKICTRARPDAGSGAAHALQSHPLKRDDPSTWVGPVPEELHLQVHERPAARTVAEARIARRGTRAWLDLHWPRVMAADLHHQSLSSAHDSWAMSSLSTAHGWLRGRRTARTRARTAGTTRTSPHSAGRRAPWASSYAPPYRAHGVS
jgi:hypothetical protein